MPDFNPHHAAVLFCGECHSNRVDVNNWLPSGEAVFQCYACGNRVPVKGLTVGRIMGPLAAQALMKAVNDIAIRRTEEEPSLEELELLSIAARR